MTGGWAAINTLREALHDGLEYFGHELDDVTGAVHAISPQAKKYDAGLDALELMEAALDAAERVTAHTQQPIDLNYVAVLKDEFEIFAAALRAVREGSGARQEDECADSQPVCECGRPLNGYRGPKCRACAGEWYAD